MKLKEIKTRLSANKRQVYVISLSGLFMILFLVFIPIFIVNLVIGILYLIIAVSYYKGKEKSEARHRRLTLLFITIIGISYITMFLTVITKPDEQITIHDGRIEYEYNGYLFDGESWYFDKDLRNANGQVEPRGEVRFPVKASLYHKLSSSERSDNDFYKFHIKTNIKFQDFQLNVVVYGSDDTDWTTKTELFNFDIYVNESAWWEGDDITWRYDSNDAEGDQCDGNEDYAYYYFVFTADVDEDQDLDFVLTWTWIEIVSDVSGGEWGYTEIEDPSLSDLMASFFTRAGGLYILITFMFAIIIVFTVSFLLFFATGKLHRLPDLLIMLTIIGVIILMVLLVYSEDFFIIKELLAIINIFPDFFGIWEAMKVLIRILGMIVAGFLWTYTIGNALLLCWGMMFLLKKYLGQYAESFIIDLNQ